MITRCLAFFLVLACLFPGQVLARELAVDPAELLPVELSSVGVEPFTGQPVALLREPKGGGIVPIFIGPGEAQAILFALREVTPPRPMTHDLMVNLLAASGTDLQRVIVDELRDGTYLGALELQLGGGDGTVLVDTRPSDGMALAARTGAPILVARAVLEAGSDIPFEGLDADEQIATAMGITVVRVTPELRQALSLPERPGVLVSAAGSLATAGGLRAGALIFEVNGETLEDPMDFLELVARTPAGEQARLRYWLDGEEADIELPTTVPESTREERQRI